MRRRSAFLGVLAAAVVSMLLGYAPAPTATADFASDCGSPTRTLTGGGNASITVAAGERLLLTGGTFSGGIDAFPDGSFLCVAGTASLSPPYLNNAAGALDVAPGGTVALPFVSVATGFDLENQGTVTFSGLNINGAARIHNLAGGTMRVSSQFSPSAGGIVNDGTFTVAGGMNLNAQASFTNTRALEVTGSSTVNGKLENTGLAAFTGSLTVNGSGTFGNRCALTTTQGFANNGASSTNDGLVQVGGLFSNNGTWLQSTTGTSTSGSLSNDGQVRGFGRYSIDTTSSTQGTFAGTSAGDPIIVHDLTPPTPPQIFDVQSGTVTNVVPAVVRAEPPTSYPAPGCTDVPRPGADVVTSKVAPPTVVAGGSLTFTITVTNNGEDPATDVVVTDTLPADLSGVTASDGGVFSGGTVVWTLGSLAVGETRELTASGTAPSTGTLLNSVSSTSATPDPDPTNNDGTSDAANTSTVVDPAPPPTNQPPVAGDLTVTGRSEVALLDRVTATDPDDGQTLTFDGPTSGPSTGAVLLARSGSFIYRPDAGFAGHDSFDYEVCDNGDPVECDTGTVSVEIFPVPVDDLASTFADTPVDIPVTANDVPGGVLTAVATPPTSGTATVVDGQVRYTPNAGLVGTDSFSYSYCSPDTPPLCDTAVVTVTVRPPDNPPILGSLTFTTTTDNEVVGTIDATDPEGENVIVVRGFPPRTGTAVVAADGSFTYTPRAGTSGVDSFAVIACDENEPRLCSTGLVTVRVFPVAVDDAASTTVGTPVTIPVLANDAGAMNEPPQVTAQPSSGSVTLAGRSLVYTPAPGFTGTDSFTYEICSPGEPLCSGATVTVDVVADEPSPSPSPSPTPSPGTGGVAGPTAGSTGSTSSPSAFDSLADTGGPAMGLLLGGLLAVLLGAGLVVTQRRRR
ncbi:MAG: Ig-like domain-containing protein [Marmoricola sp.]